MEPLISTSVSEDWLVSTHADLRPHAARYSTNGTSVPWRLRWVSIYTLNYTFLWLADSSDFGLLEEQSSPAQDADEPPYKIWRRQLKFILAREIRNRTNKQKQTNSNRYIHTLPIGVCG